MNNKGADLHILISAFVICSHLNLQNKKINVLASRCSSAGRIEQIPKTGFLTQEPFLCCSLLLTRAKIEEVVYGPEMALNTCRNMMKLWKGLQEIGSDE